MYAKQRILGKGARHPGNYQHQPLQSSYALLAAAVQLTQYLRQSLGTITAAHRFVKSDDVLINCSIAGYQGVFGFKEVLLRSQDIAEVYQPLFVFSSVSDATSF